MVMMTHEHENVQHELQLLSERASLPMLKDMCGCYLQAERERGEREREREREREIASERRAS
jgi:hypothetical protein